MSNLSVNSTPDTNHSLTEAQLHRLVDIVLFKQRLLIKYFTRRDVGKISVTQFIMLDQLAARGPLNMGQLAQIMRHTTPATTGIVDRLIAAELVERKTNPNDRRQIVIALTPKGAGTVRALRERMAQFLAEAAKRMTVEEQQAWYQTNEALYRIEPQLTPPPPEADSDRI
ncbi:MAG: MarR family transcriptional regulator [Verrucomicrobiales bacterium]|jgi:DNA-binding MarR family transcriptional regulator|nr:MarR family transcriptional regulator [Verrucomicrobiales bacterium]